MGFNFTRRQWMTIITFAMQFVLHCKHHFTLRSPIYGAHLNWIGPNLLFNGGILTTGTCAILFGMLDRFEDHMAFITLSFIIRIVEAMGNAAFLTASFAIIAKEFPNNIATMFVSPTVGGALYTYGGYSLPFAVLGFALFCAAIMSCVVLPRNHDDEDFIISTSMSIGFLQATLEPHLRQFNLSPMVLGLMFVINGGVYAISAPFWGWMCDQPYIKPKYVTVIGCFFVAGAFLLIGPAHFFDMPTILWVCVSGLVLHGLGIGSQLGGHTVDDECFRYSRRCGISVEQSRPPAMNSLIACSSFKNRRSPWSQRTPKYYPTYGSLDHRYRGAQHK
ncbi:putative MFS-type transporter [Operophtera brumata]|uniref:Putative MFS-type transporter n=1 Tax=Operophtera brumata TaxID=104452 RepID=A0A0L7LLF2_OPEBR|nr:putative MFS-type transporter [Operophtera brumata]